MGVASGLAETPVQYQDLKEAINHVKGDVRNLLEAHSAQSMAAQANLNSMLTESFNTGLDTVERRLLDRMARAESEAARAHARLSGHDAQLATLAGVLAAIARLEEKNKAL